jgi:hypothetical protein
LGVNIRDHLAAEKARKELGLIEGEGGEDVEKGADDKDEAAVDRRSTALHSKLVSKQT